MEVHSTCSQTCSTPCQQSAPQPISLAEARERFDREATRGICDTGRYRAAYYSWGNGPPLVFIHGVADSSRSFVLPIARLSAHFRCIAYELAGNRGDGANLWRYRHEHFADDLLALLDHLKLERAYVYGASFGATIALRALRREPNRLPRAILQSGTAYRPLSRGANWLSWLARVLPGSVASIPKREKILEKGHKHTFAQQPEEVWRTYLEETASARLATLAHQGQWLHRLDLRDELPHITQPVLLLWGDRDTTMPMTHADLLRAGLPSAGLVVIEGAGHVPCYSHPDAVAEVVRQFLTPPSATCPGPEACVNDGRHSLPCANH